MQAIKRKNQAPASFNIPMYVVINNLILKIFELYLFVFQSFYMPILNSLFNAHTVVRVWYCVCGEKVVSLQKITSKKG